MQISETLPRGAWFSRAAQGIATTDASWSAPTSCFPQSPERILRRIGVYSVSSDLRSHRGRMRLTTFERHAQTGEQVVTAQISRKQMTCLTAQPISSDADRPQSEKSSLEIPTATADTRQSQCHQL